MVVFAVSFSFKLCYFHRVVHSRSRDKERIDSKMLSKVHSICTRQLQWINLTAVSSLLYESSELLGIKINCNLRKQQSKSSFDHCPHLLLTVEATGVCRLKCKYKAMSSLLEVLFNVSSHAVCSVGGVIINNQYRSRLTNHL